MPRTPVTILPPSPSDYAAIAALETEVFSADPITVYTFGPARLTASALADRAASLSRPSPHPFYAVRIRKAVTPEGRIVGYAYWKFCDDAQWLERLKETEKVKEAENVEAEKALEETKSGPPPEGTNLELHEGVFGESGAEGFYHRSMGGRPHAALNILVVLAEFQGQGIGKALIDEGLAEVDRRGFPCWLAATEPALEFYKNVGFVVDEVLLFDMKPYGGATVEKHAPMVRHARARTG